MNQNKKYAQIFINNSQVAIIPEVEGKCFNNEHFYEDWCDSFGHPQSKLVSQECYCGLYKYDD